jgi:hypothetical protein
MEWNQSNRIVCDLMMYRDETDGTDIPPPGTCYYVLFEVFQRFLCRGRCSCGYEAARLVGGRVKLPEMFCTIRALSKSKEAIYFWPVICSAREK